MSLFVIALGGIFAFGITENPSGANIHVIGLILMGTGSAGLLIGQRLYNARRRTDVYYRSDGETWIEPNMPPHDPTGSDGVL